MRIQKWSICWICGGKMKRKSGMCDFCREAFARSVEALDNEQGKMAHDCSMCGKPCESVDKNGHCSSCRQVWNS